MKLGTSQDHTDIIQPFNFCCQLFALFWLRGSKQESFPPKGHLPLTILFTLLQWCDLLLSYTYVPVSKRETSMIQTICYKLQISNLVIFQLILQGSWHGTSLPLMLSIWKNLVISTWRITAYVRSLLMDSRGCCQPYEISYETENDTWNH